MATDPAVESIYNLDLKRFYRIYRNVHHMLFDRGYKPTSKMLNEKQLISKYLGYLAELEDPDCELDVFGLIDNMALIFSKNGKQMLVYFHPLDSKLCQKDMNYIHTMMKEKNTHHLIIVANNNATPKVANVLGILGNRAQLFSEDELIFNVTKHQMVPRHSLASPEERKSILEMYTILEDGKQHLELIPGIFTVDPIVKYFNFKADDLIRIERPRKDGFFDLSYRIVTHPMTEKDCKS